MAEDTVIVATPAELVVVLLPIVSALVLDIETVFPETVLEKLSFKVTVKVTLPDPAVKLDVDALTVEVAGLTPAATTDSEKLTLVDVPAIVAVIASPAPAVFKTAIFVATPDALVVVLAVTLPAATGIAQLMVCPLTGVAPFKTVTLS